MFELVLTFCLGDISGQCTERRVETSAPTTLAHCMEHGPELSSEFAHALPQFSLRNWRCTSRGASVEPLMASRAGDAAHTFTGHTDTGQTVTGHTKAQDDGFAVTQIADGVFVHTGHHDVPSPLNAGDLSNAGFVIGAEAVAVIDTGGSVLVGQKLLKSIRAQTDLPIRYVILTHMHPDHVLGAKVFADEGASIIGHHKLGAALAARVEGYEDNIRRLIGDEAFAGSAVVAPDEGVNEPLRLDLGDRTLLLESHATAHTDNDLTVLDEKTGTWFLGDLLFLEHLPALDGSLLGWLKVLERLSQRDAARAVPGHGPASVAWPQGGAPMLSYLRTLAEETRRAIRDGATLHEATLIVGKKFAKDWHLFEEFNARNVTAAYRELEWE